MSFSEFSEFHSDISVLAGTQGGYVNGRWVKSSGEAQTIQGSVQPITGRALAALNIGRRDLGKVYLYTDTLLKVSNSEAQENGDEISWEGDVYEIMQKAPWKNNLINHYQYIAEYRRRDT